MTFRYILVFMFLLMGTRVARAAFAVIDTFDDMDVSNWIPLPSHNAALDVSSGNLVVSSNTHSDFYGAYLAGNELTDTSIRTQARIDGDGYVGLLARTHPTPDKFYVGGITSDGVLFLGRTRELLAFSETTLMPTTQDVGFNSTSLAIRCGYADGRLTGHSPAMRS